jgi:exodeoxyribonuclease VII large subunit
MMDLIDDEPGAGGQPGGNAPEFSVSEIAGEVKRTLEGAFGRVRVRGEVGRVFPARSGHLYFDLKDDKAVLASVSWKGSVARMAVKPEEGMEVIATGRLTTFPGQSKYQLIVDDVAPAGVGALMAMLEKRKAALAAEGLFAAERKRPIPFLPGVIGVVTSPQGAVIRDILHRLRDRFPRHVLVWPVAVQGERCAPDVARAIAGFNALREDGPIPRPDLLIVARGGGSLEDLWGFNEEIVARAAAASRIPLISAVGHETDTTLIDFVSDRRAPTPTAAAELAVPVRLDLLAHVEGQGARLTRAAGQAVALRAQRLRDLGRALPRLEELIDRPAQRLDLLSDRLERAMQARLDRPRLRLDSYGARLRPQALERLVADRGQRLRERGGALDRALTGRTRQAARDLAGLGGRLRAETLLRRRAQAEGELARLVQRLGRAGTAQVTGWRTRLEALDRMRQTLGYTETLKRGFAVVYRADGGVVTHAAGAQGALEIEFQDGKVPVAAGGAAPSGGSGGSPRTKPKPPEQGSLF